jgi:anti-sigma regulatory factor (Ser/Thr protein kinase)
MATGSFPVSPESVSEARRFIATFLPGHSAELRETAELLVSELATNALLYGQGGFELSVEHEPLTETLRIGITDFGPDAPRMGNPSETDEHGRGLQLLEALADRWGVQWDPDAAGKTVWFELVLNRALGAVDSEPVADADLLRTPEVVVAAAEGPVLDSGEPTAGQEQDPPPEFLAGLRPLGRQPQARRFRRAARNRSRRCSRPLRQAAWGPSATRL